MRRCSPVLQWRRTCRLAPPPPPVVYYDWSGAYVGGNVGGIWSTVDQTFPSPLGFGPGPGSQNNFSTSPNEGIFGFHAGAQWQWGAWVLGVEAALSGCFQECQAFSGIVTNPANTFFEHKITNLFTVGPRIGYAWDRLDDLRRPVGGLRPISSHRLAAPPSR